MSQRLSPEELDKHNRIVRFILITAGAVVLVTSTVLLFWLVLLGLHMAR